jgi:hypothetical protein
VNTILCILALLPLGGDDNGLAPWANDRQPSDLARRHVQEITGGRAEYKVVQGGTMDGQNCRSPQGVWQPFSQTWESNRSVRMENVGEADVDNPWLSNGRNDFRSLDAILASAVEPGMSENDKAMSLWWQEIQHRFHFEGDNSELSSPVKVLNVYGHNTCGNDSICLAGQWKKAGLKVAPARLVGHCVTQVFYDGGWHLFDGDMHSMYLLRDNETVAGEQDIVRDHDLVRRTHTQGILQPDGRAGDEWESSIYVFEGKVNGDRNADLSSSMNMTLRPGEAIVWRWGHTTPVKYHGTSPPKFPDRICNGLWEYRPDFTRETWRKGAELVEGIHEQPDGLAAEAAGTGTIVWKVSSPYVFVGGRLEIDGTDAKFAISWDGKSWEECTAGLDRHFPPQGSARYSYQLRCQLSGAARLKRLAIINDVQMAPLSLPGMEIGENFFAYTDTSVGERKLRITHEWVERSASKPPSAPAEPIEPRDGGEAEGTGVVFRWKPAVDPDSDAIADYQFELSARPDMKWPLSMSFAKLISRTADAGKPRFTLDAPGQLNPDREYYWHVRAQDARGVWGPWSRTWRFTPRGPAPPLDVTVAYDGERNAGILRWKPNPQGRPAASYRIYASDEKGFSAGDEPYRVTTGISKELPSEFPANFVVETRETELPVTGPGVRLPGANKAFYRVVAVDRAGRRSGPSDYAEAPRPVIFSRPAAMAKKGAEYRYDLSVIRSLGDLRTRVVEGRETMSFWDIERPRFRLERGPEWLKIDEATGRLSGKPESTGKADVVVTVRLERPLRRLKEDDLKWGREEVVSSGTETVGSSKQSFVIEVEP